MKWILNSVKYIAGLLLLLLLLLPAGLYFYGLSYIEPQLSPPKVLFQRNILLSYRTWLGEPDESKYRKLNPYSFIFSIAKLTHDGARRGSDVELYSLSSKRRMLATKRKGSMGMWHLSSASALVYVSRNWSIEQNVSEILNTSYFGRQTFGLENASALYFGRSAEKLNDAEKFALFHLTISPTRYDLWCFPERLKESSLLKRRGVVIETSDINLLPKPANACDHLSN